MRKFVEFWVLAAAMGALFMLSDRTRGGVIDVRAGQCFALFAAFSGLWRIITARRGLEFLWDKFAAGCVMMGGLLALLFMLGGDGAHGYPPPMCLIYSTGLGTWFVMCEVSAAWWRRRRAWLRL